MKIQNVIKKLKQKQDLLKEEAAQMQEEIITGKVSTGEIVGLFEAFEGKEMIKDELLGIVETTRKHMITVEVEFDCLDTCGTGGDRLNTFNISTISALVCAAAGIPVAKHGNRAASSKSGSADVLEALGVNIMLSPEEAKKCLEEAGIVFMFAPHFHPALRHVKEARTTYGKRTYFNFLGPLLNPAKSTHQVIGVSDHSKVGLMGEVLMQNGSCRVTFVTGSNGMDEVSLTGDTQMVTYDKGRGVSTKNFHPMYESMKVADIIAVQGGTAQDNANIILNILKDDSTEEQKNVVLLNAGLGISTFRGLEMSEGIEVAREMIESGKALKKLYEFIKISNLT